MKSFTRKNFLKYILINEHAQKCNYLAILKKKKTSVDFCFVHFMNLYGTFIICPVLRRLKQIINPYLLLDETNFINKHKNCATHHYR